MKGIMISKATIKLRERKKRSEEGLDDDLQS